MKNLRNFLRAILWVWGVAGVLATLVMIVLSDNSWLLWAIGALVLMAVTWIVYVGLNGDLEPR